MVPSRSHPNIRTREDSPTLGSQFSSYLDGFHCPATESTVPPTTSPTRNYTNLSRRIPSSLQLTNVPEFEWEPRWVQTRKRSKKSKKSGWSITSILWIVGGVVITIILAAQIANHFLQPEEDEDDDEVEEKEAPIPNQKKKKEIQCLASEELLPFCGPKKASNELLRRLKFLEKCALTKELGEEL